MSYTPSADEIIKTYGLQEHPEGGFFKETYRSKQLLKQSALNGSHSGDRYIATAIYFLLKSSSKSHFHRIRSDEIWHFYLGGPLNLVEITPDGRKIETKIGPNILQGEKLQYVVKAGHWFGAFPVESSPYSFVGCTVAPGFDFSDFELGTRDGLQSLFPTHQRIIEKLTT